MVSVGDTVGSLKVLEYVGKKRASSLSKYDTNHYLCSCSCGKQVEVNEASLEYRVVKNCGCNNRY